MLALTYCGEEPLLSFQFSVLPVISGSVKSIQIENGKALRNALDSSEFFGSGNFESRDLHNVTASEWLVLAFSTAQYFLVPTLIVFALSSVHFLTIPVFDS